MTRLPLLALIALLAACGGNEARFAIATEPAADKVRVGVPTIEVRDVSLPSYAAASEIVVEGEDGALRPLKGSVWADDPIRAVTGALALGLDARTTASVSAEPWPLLDPPALRIETRIDAMVAKADATFQMTGQVALTSRNGSARDRIERFAISVPMADQSPAGVAAATGQAIAKLSERIAGLL
jgi:uncharacterized protein